MPKSHSNGGAEIKPQVHLSAKSTLYTPGALQPRGQALSFCGQAVPALKSNSTTYDTSSIQVFTCKVGVMMIHTS